MALTTLAIAGVLTAVETAPNLLRRLAATDYRRLVAVAVTLVLAWAGYSYTHDWMPTSGGAFSGWTAHAFAEPLPDGTYVASAGGRDQTPWFPVDPIKDDVTRVLGPNPRAVTLSVDERLFSYLPWPGYTWDDLGGSLAHSFERVAEVRKLEGIRDPAAFADASRHTAYGPIDIFVLKISDGGWVWVAPYGLQPPRRGGHVPTDAVRPGHLVRRRPAAERVRRRRPPAVLTPHLTLRSRRGRAIAPRPRLSRRRYRYWPVLLTVSMARPASAPLPPETSVRM